MKGIFTIDTRRLWTLILVVAVLSSASLTAAHAAPPAQDPLAECDALSEDAVRAELNSIAQEIFGDVDAAGSLEAIVARQWIALNMDRVVDTAVAEAVDQVRTDEALLETVLSGWSPAKAEALTARVADVAFAGETFRLALDDLSLAVARDLEAELALLSAESASRNLACLQQFITGSYSGAVVAAFQETIRTETTDIVYDGDDGVDSGLMAVLEQHRPAIGGIGVIIAAQVSRRLLQRMGRSVSRRVAGRITSRLLGRAGATLIPLAGWIIGGGLIAYDIYDSLDGALPQIEASLTSPEVKLAIQTEIVRAIEPDLRREMPQLAREVADDLYTSWLDFKRQYRQVLDLAARDPEFAQIMAASTDLAGLADLLDAAMTTIGVDGVDDAVNDGRFARLLALPMPETALLLRDTGSLESVFAWAGIAENRLDAVAALELHRVARADEFDAATLDRLLALNDPVMARKLAAVSPDDLAALLSMSSASLSQLATRMTPEELTALGRALDGLDPARQTALITALVNNPGADAALTRGLGGGLVDSRNMAAAVAFATSPADPVSYPGDLLSVSRGDVSPRLLPAKYGWPVVGVTLLVILALAFSLLNLLLRPFITAGRLLFGQKG